MTERFDELEGWRFEVAEISAGVYQVVGRDDAGQRVDAKGTDPDSLLLDAKHAAQRTGPDIVKD